MGTVLLFGPFHIKLQECFQVLGTRGAEVFWEKHEKGFLALLKHRQPSVVIVENGVHGTECRNFTDMVVTRSPYTAVLMLTEGGVCPQAYGLGQKLESVCQAHHTAQENILLAAENLLFGEEPPPSDLARGLFCRTSSPSMKSLEAMVKKITDTDATVLIQGETGVGKGVLASYIHARSPRCDKPFIKINCAALPSELLESELFGFDRGAFTGAHHAKPGKFESANGGTILLDEIGELSLPMQAKLLHVLEDNQFARLGATKDIRVDVRVLALTNRDLKRAVKAGQFRTDLYFRLKVMTLTIPPLRERIQEIPLLAAYFIEKFAKQYERHTVQFSPKVWTIFQSYSWPGNVRELENFIKQAVILQDENFIEQELKLDEPKVPVRDGPPIFGGGLKEISRKASREAERKTILGTLQHTHWNRTLAAQILQISYKTLLYKIQEAGLRGPDQERLKPEDLIHDGK